MKVTKFWFYYFCERLFYLFFDIFVYGKLSSLGDTSAYLAGAAGIKLNPLIDSTSLMSVVGGTIGKLTFHIDLLSNFPFMLLSFYIVRWAVEKLNIIKQIGNRLTFILISLPNFCIWTSILSKETVGLVFSAILGVLFINFFNGDFKIRWRDWIATYLCLLFKPQYFPFIFAGLSYIYLCHRIKSPQKQFTLAIFIISIAILILISLQPLVDELALQMYAHFNFNGASTRDNIFTSNGDFYRHAPLGMLQAFVGPNIAEITHSPLNLIAAIESWFIVAVFLWLSTRSIIRLLSFGKLSPIPFFSIFLTTVGILFIHYPFGIFNPGSAIRYRTNFLFLFIILFIYLYCYYKPHLTVKSSYRIPSHLSKYNSK